mgnify:FL=1
MSADPPSPQWPQKIRKFGIEDPSLRYLASKYESAIPWQQEVRNEKELLRYVRRTLLPSLVERLSASGNGPPDQRYFVRPSRIQLERVLHGDAHLTAAERTEAEQLRQVEGKQAAQRYTADLINRKKEASFQEWIRKVRNYWFKSEHAFVYLVLRGMLDGLGKGTLRLLNPPDRQILTWLQNRVHHERLPPHGSVSEEYRWLATLWTEVLGSGNSRGTPPAAGTTETGWAFFPRGYDPHALSRLCQGSGWCISSPSMAEDFLRQNSFYLLFEERKPRIALRVKTSGSRKRIVECVRTHNRFPEGFEADIELFAQTLELKNRFRYADQLTQNAQALLRENSTSVEWWRQRITNWPFALGQAIPAIQEELRFYARGRTSLYQGFPGVLHSAQNSDQLQGSETMDAAVQLLQEKPFLLPKILKKLHLQNSQVPRVLTEAAIDGWVQLLRDDLVPARAFNYVPTAVLHAPEVLRLLADHYPREFRERIRTLKKSRRDREKPFRLEKWIPEQPDEPPLLARERMVEALLHDKTGLLNNHLFSTLSRERPDFQELRREAWKEAMEVEPPLWFALPDDLRETSGFHTYEGRFHGRANGPQWLRKIRAKPWYLLHSGFPTSLRRHRRILRAYRDSWAERLRAHPWRLWEQIDPPSLQGRKNTLDPKGVKNYRRVYPSYALLSDPVVLNALTEGWRNDRHGWRKVSARMQTIPAIQLSFLRAFRQKLDQGEEFLEDLRFRQCLEAFWKMEPYAILHDKYAREIRELRLEIHHRTQIPL